jgi:hypothetical protein
MRIAKIMVLGIFAAVLFAGCASIQAARMQSRHDVLYMCNCGPKCSCNTVSTHPGNCKCGKPMVAGHVLKIKGHTAYVCMCGKDCNCKLDPKHPNRCGCGKRLKRVNLKGTGIYFCNCGGSCQCNTVSDRPGKCKCGMKLKKVD